MLSTLLSLLILSVPTAQAAPERPCQAAGKLIDNERVAVQDMLIFNPAIARQGKLQYDAVGVRLTGQVGQPFYFKKGAIRNLDVGCVIWVDLKDAPGHMENKTKYPNAFPRPGVKKVLENDRVIVWDYTWTPAKPTPMHFHDKDVVVVYVENGELRSTTPDGKSDANAISFGLVRFNRRDRTHSEELTKGSARAIIIELK